MRMQKIQEDVWFISENMDLTYSDHDGGYYFTKFPDYQVSITYPTLNDAVMAFDNDEIEWEVK